MFLGFLSFPQEASEPQKNQRKARTDQTPMEPITKLQLELKMTAQRMYDLVGLSRGSNDIPQLCRKHPKT